METVERAWVPGYLFIPTEEISCHIINGHHGQLWFRVLAPGGTPYRVKDEDMARMRDVPSRVKDLVDEAKRQEYEAWQAVRPVIGEIARVTRGTFAGTRGVVKAIHGGEVAIDTNGPIKAIKVPESIAERVT
jgi:transcription antitermination factor NusG